MGRKKKQLTKEQIEERKKRWWGEERNRRRRERYRNDPEYRKRLQRQSREYYREEAGVDREDCRSNLDKLGNYGIERLIRPAPHAHLPNVEFSTLAFTTQEVADLIDRNRQVLYRWITSNMWPEPIFRWQNHGVYTEGEVRAMLQVFGEHQQKSRYYRKDNEETKQKLFNAVEAARTEVKEKDVENKTGEAA